jgi:hypothetical protein
MAEFGKLPPLQPEETHEAGGPVGPDIYAFHDPGGIQLAERYASAGITIDFDAHPYTTSDESRSQTSDRRALIETNKNLLYLHGDMLYGFTGLEAGKEITEMELPENFQMFNVTIGTGMAFSPNDSVQSITIATEKHKASGIVQGAHNEPQNIFSILDELIENYDERHLQVENNPDALRREKLAILETVEAINSEHSESHRMRENRLGVTNQPPKMRQIDAEVPLIRSRHGVVISPQPPVNQVKGAASGATLGYDRERGAYRSRTSHEAVEKVKRTVKSLGRMGIAGKKNHELQVRQDMSQTERDAHKEYDERELSAKAKKASDDATKPPTDRAPVVLTADEERRLRSLDLRHEDERKESLKMPKKF